MYLAHFKQEGTQIQDADISDNGSGASQRLSIHIGKTTEKRGHYESNDKANALEHQSILQDRSEEHIYTLDVTKRPRISNHSAN